MCDCRVLVHRFLRPLYGSGAELSAVFWHHVLRKASGSTPCGECILTFGSSRSTAGHRRKRRSRRRLGRASGRLGCIHTRLAARGDVHRSSSASARDRPRGAGASLEGSRGGSGARTPEGDCGGKPAVGMPAFLPLGAKSTRAPLLTSFLHLISRWTSDSIQ